MAAPMKVLIGMKDEVVATNKSHFLTNKIGGIPDWIYAEQLTPVCRLCGNTLYLITQIYCPLEGSRYHRTLYIFACANHSCWNKSESWRILRSQKLSITTSTKVEQVLDEASVTSTDWCQDADDWGQDADDWGQDADDWGEVADESHGDADITAHCQEMLGIPTSPVILSWVEGNGGKNNRKVSNQIHTSAVEEHKNTGECISKLLSLKLSNDLVVHTSSEFLSYYINVFEEPTEQFATEHEQRLLKDYEQREGLDLMEWYDDLGNKSTRNEKYEKTSALHGDIVFEKFLKRTALCPQQCLRYCWGGSPLYIRKPEKSYLNQENCKYCGSKMTYELQLMPTLVRMLKDKSNSDKTVEFGVVLIYTCSKSCWSDDDTSCRDEVVIVQSDPDQDLFEVKE